MPAIAERRGVSLRDYGGSGAPVLFVPSLINPPNILDLDEERSLLRWLAKRGHRVLLLDWGQGISERQNLSIAGM
jgi:polyhydroxyalkanoate synthase